MCGRYALDKTADELAQRFRVARVPATIQPNYNVAPAQAMPVITESSDGIRSIELMSWGIHRTLGKDRAKELINTRSDKAFGGFWRKTVCYQRCLVPATGFYEWKAEVDGKTPYYIYPKDEDLYAFAGIWDTWLDSDGTLRKAFSIVTVEPNKEMRAIHNRMPAILHRADEAAWLELSNDSRERLEQLLFPSEDGRFEMYEVSKDVNDPHHNDRSLLTPVK